MNNHTTSTETTVSVTSSQFQCLIDPPASFAGTDEIRMLGRALRDNLDEVIQNMFLQVGTESAIQLEVDKTAYRSIR